MFNDELFSELWLGGRALWRRKW